MRALPKPGSPVTRRLLVHSNGVIALETREPGWISTGFAPGLQYRLEYRAKNGSWVPIHGTYDNDREARAALAAANKRIIWRLVAFNEYGSVALPRNWRGYYR